MTACADDLEDFSWTDELDEVEEFIASSDEEMATDEREALEAMCAAEQAMRDAAGHRAQHPGNLSGNKRREKEGIAIRHERCNMDHFNDLTKLGLTAPNVRALMISGCN